MKSVCAPTKVFPSQQSPDARITAKNPVFNNGTSKISLLSILLTITIIAAATYIIIWIKDVIANCVPSLNVGRSAGKIPHIAITTIETRKIATEIFAFLVTCFSPSTFFLKSFTSPSATLC